MISISRIFLSPQRLYKRVLQSFDKTFSRWAEVSFNTNVESSRFLENVVILSNVRTQNIVKVLTLIRINLKKQQKSTHFNNFYPLAFQ